MRNSFADMIQVIHDYMSDPETMWPICKDAAFVQDAEKPAELQLDQYGGSLVGDRCAMRVAITPMVRLVPREVLSLDDSLWYQGTLICLPESESTLSQRHGIAELGNDLLAMRTVDRLGMLFDLGIGHPSIDYCVRTTDDALCDMLRNWRGKAADDPIWNAIREAEADHVIQSRLGRVEWFGCKPSEAALFDKFSPPPGMVACLAFIPPQRTECGEIDRATFDTFRFLQEAFGDPTEIAMKREVHEAVREGQPPGMTLEHDTATHASLVQIALRQLLYTDGPSDALKAWRDVFD